MNAASDSGLKVPTDVELLSLVGTKYARITRPSLSCFNVDMNEVGKRAMYMLTELLNGELVNRTAKFDAEYCRGASTINRSGNDADYE